ncbi:MAG: DUF2795 domain-containing protein [Chloroflexi bacterium]|nr:MAG: DUF2795 domain-containing protein [Chloroflexota bacterium]
MLDKSPGNLIRHAQQQGADQQVLESLKHLPDKTFEGSAGVSKASGEIDGGSKGSP